MRSQLMWWIMFAVATVALSKVLEASRVLTRELPLDNPLMTVLWLVVLVLSALYLAYDSYSKARRQGKVVHPIGWFEAIYTYQNQETRR